MTDLAHDYIVAPPSTLTATVRGPLGPLSGATVYASGETAKTDSNGVAVLHLSPGTYDVKASHLGYADETKSVDVTQDGATVEFDLTLLFVPIGPAASRDALMAFAVVTLAQDEDEALRLFDEHAPRAYRGLLTGKGWQWDDQTQTYVSRTGTTLDGHDIKRLSILFAIAIETDELEPLAEQMAAGAITIEQWQLSTAAVLRELYIAQALIASGGRGHLAPEDIAAIQGSVEAKTGLEYGMDRLDNFGAAIAEAKPGADGAMQVTRRAGFYADTSNTLAEDVRRNSHRRAKDTETGKLLFLYERNVLAHSEHCHNEEYTLGCPTVTAAGWQPIDTLTRIGERTCSFRCLCSWEFILVPDGNEHLL